MSICRPAVPLSICGDSGNIVLNGNFTLPIYIDLAATFLFGLTGAIAALKRGYDWVGLSALAFATAVGGGLIRDGIFISQGPPVVTKDSRYILLILASVIVAIVLKDKVFRLNKLIAWLDALGLGAYAVVGVQKSLEADLSVAAAILVGAVNAAGGGLLRDVISREEPLVFKPGQFYVLAAVAGCVLFVVLTLQMKAPAALAAVITIAVTFLIRVLAIQFNWKTSSVWQEKDSVGK